MNEKPRVAVAMSGGVDSSVAAALLVEQGYHVIGFMLRLWSESGSDRSNRCCTPDSIAMARQVASILSIPFYVLDAKQVFYEAVVKSFIDDYTRGYTPNPCVACNRLVRWRFLLDYALAAGADFLATGHYARLVQDPGGSIQILRGVDPSKDQSYVLHVLRQEQLAHAMFPLGGYNKSKVRETAHHFGLPVADRPDSQDLCFVGGDGDYRKFLGRYAPEAAKPGDIVDSQGKFLGKHAGLPFYTIGQRKGLQLTVPGPMYVLEKDLLSNSIIAGRRDQCTKVSFIAEQVNWIAGEFPQSPFQSTVKIRYKAQEMPAVITILEGDAIQVKLERPAMDITPGQAAVIYNGDICLGGGIIASRTE